jgi:hypothetical protein
MKPAGLPPKLVFHGSSYQKKLRSLAFTVFSFFSLHEISGLLRYSNAVPHIMFYTTEPNQRLQTTTRSSPTSTIFMRYDYSPEFCAGRV